MEMSTSDLKSVFRDETRLNQPQAVNVSTAAPNLPRGLLEGDSEACTPHIGGPWQGRSVMFTSGKIPVIPKLRSTSRNGFAITHSKTLLMDDTCLVGSGLDQTGLTY